MTLDFLVINTYTTETLAIADTSVYDTDPPVVSAPTMQITVTGYTSPVAIPFNVQQINTYNSIILGLTVFPDTAPLPDGVYFMRYSVAPSTVNYVEKNIMRTAVIQEKFDSAFMKLDMMECDRAIKTQQKVNLTSIYFFIQASIAAANNCAIIESNKLYTQANSMLDNFIKNNCYCSGTNYVVNFG